MRRALLILLATLALAAAIAAGGFAATAYYWQESGVTYSCQGISRGVTCKETNWKPAYSIRIFPGYVTVTFGSNIIFACERGFTPAGNCEYYGP